MKLAIVSGHYTPELGYQEGYLARAYARLGHQVRIVTSTAISPTSRAVVDRPYDPGMSTDPDYGFEIQRLPVRIAYSANVICRGVREAVEEFQPDIIVIIGIAKIFPGPLLCEEVALGARLIAIFGDSRDYVYRASLSKKIRYALQRILFLLTKRRLYRKAVHYCETIVLNHVEAQAVLLDALPSRDHEMFRRKCRLTTLGFDPDEFFFDDRDRKATRAEMGIAPEEIVLVTATRINPRKGLESVVRRVAQLRRSGNEIRYILIGFMGDDYDAELKALIRSLGCDEAFLCFPFMDREEIRKAYCAADIGIWLKAAISIQQAMGTGLAVILDDKPIVGHLVEEGINGWYFHAEDVDEVIAEAVREISLLPSEERSLRRQDRAGANAAKLSYDAIAAAIIE